MNQVTKMHTPPSLGVMDILSFGSSYTLRIRSLVGRICRLGYCPGMQNNNCTPGCILAVSNCVYISLNRYSTMFGRCVSTVKVAHCSNKVLDLHTIYDKRLLLNLPPRNSMISFLVCFICMNVLFPDVDSQYGHDRLRLTLINPKHNSSLHSFYHNHQERPLTFTVNKELNFQSHVHYVIL